jgi:hypothetical protein
MSDVVFPNLLEQFSNSLVRDDVGIAEFCESSDYCGKQLYPRQRVLLKLIFLEELNGYEEDVLTEWIKSSETGGEVTISPKIRERVQWLRDNHYPHFSVVQIVGGRRSGKGYMTGGAIAYKAYQLVQLQNPGAHYNIEEGKDIYFTIVADSLDQAKRHQFRDARNWLIGCKPLVQNGYVGQPLAESISIFTPFDLSRIQTLKSAGRTVEGDALASLRVQAFPKNAGTIRGSASIVLDFDEMAHMTPGESHISDEELYGAAEPSLIQFKKDALIFANSSPWSKTGMFYKLFEMGAGSKAMDGDDPAFPSHLTIQYPSWEMYKDWDRAEWHGKYAAAIVVDPKYDVDLALKEKANPEKFKVEYRAHFAEVVDAYLNPDRVDEMFDPYHQEMILGRRLRSERGANSPYFVYKGHADPSSTGANFGIAIGHLEEVPEIDEHGVEINAPHVVFDYINAFYPDDFPNSTIDWLTVLPTIEELINSFRPDTFTFDQFESDAAMQILTDRLMKSGRANTQVFEVTATAAKNFRRSEHFKAALNLGRVHAPHPSGQMNEKALSLARNELKFLQVKNNRVDKQSAGPIQTKDIADCIMEVTSALVGDIYGGPSFPDEMGFGSPGGYTLKEYMGSTGTGFESFYEQGVSVARRGDWTGSNDPARGRRRGLR